MNITILGSCRQQSISTYFNTTSIQNRLTYPHYTREIIQAIEYCKGINTFNNDLSRYCFRTGILDKKNITYQNELKHEFDNTDVFVIEIASRIYYKWNDVYVHHILTEHGYEFPYISDIIVGNLSDEEIEHDILKIKELLYPKRVLIVPHIYTKKNNKRYELVELLHKITNKHNIPFLDLSEILYDKDNSLIYQNETPLHHYTEYGHSIVGYEYKKIIDKLSTMPIPERVCIHTYLNVCKTIIQSPGLADFLRGTITLFNLSKLYNYKLLIDNSHPMFSYIKPNKYLISNNIFPETIEILPPKSYEEIYNNLNSLFRTNTSFSVLTNSFYTIYDNRLINFGNISEECRMFLQELLQPTIDIEEKIQYIFNNIYNFNMNDGYKIIHLRCGDDFLHHNIYDNNIYLHYYNKIHNLVNNNTLIKFVLISDSSTIADKLKEEIPTLHYWHNSKIHLGDLKNNSSLPTGIIDTLVDFFIMSKSNEIMFCSNQYDSSGFSTVNSLIYNIKLSII